MLSTNLEVNVFNFAIPSRITKKARKVLEILDRDGGITHLTAQHYNIGSITKEIQRIRSARPSNFMINTVKRKDAEGNQYTRWTVKKAA